MKHLPFLFLFLLLSISSITYAQLGEEAGPLIFNITPGGSQTLNYSILNAGSSPINFTVLLPMLSRIPNNETPIIKVYPMNGTLAPRSQQVMHITVFMPAKDKPGLTWSGGYSPETSGIMVVENAPSVTNGEGIGAVVYAAVIKGLIITSATPSINILLIVIILLLIAIIICIIVYYYRRKRANQKIRKKREQRKQQRQRRKLEAKQESV